MTEPQNAAGFGGFGDPRELVTAQLPAAVQLLSELARIPSVSWEAFDRAHVQASAARIAELAAETGFFESVTVQNATLPSGETGQPAVLAHRPAQPGFPSVVLYAHHDVQPPGESELWESAPFEPTERDGRLYGRGTSDDKAGVVTHLTVAKLLADRLGNDFPVGVTLFVEGEEEAGSRTFGQFLADHTNLLDAAAIVVCDSDNVDTETPAITTALRGNVTFRLSLRTLEHANHSGMFGGAVPDAVMAFIRLLDTCWNEDGSVAIDGLASADLPSFDYDEAQLRHESGLIGVPIGNGSITSRLWAQPSVTVTGMNLPSVAEASNTLIPQLDARISVRVAPGQSASAAWDAVRSHFERNVPWAAQVEFSDVDLGESFLVDTSGPHVQLMRQSLRAGWDAEPAEVGIGGSIPFISLLAEQFPRAEIVVTAVGDPLSQPHSPNESQHLGVLRNAIESELRYLIAVAAAE